MVRVMEDLSLQWAPIAALVAVSGYVLLLVLTVRTRGLPGVAERWFAGYLVLSAVWTAAWALANVWSGIQPQVVDVGATTAVYTAALLPVALAVLTLHFLPRRGAKELALLGLAWAITLALLERGVLGGARAGTILDVLRLVGWAGFMIASVVMTALEYVRLRRPLHRNRVLYWLIALLLIALGEGLHFFKGEGMAQVGLPLRLLGALMMTYAITTYSLPDLKSAGRRFLLMAVVTLVQAALYLAAIVAAVLAYRSVQDAAALEDRHKLWLIVTGGITIPLFLAILQAPVQKLVVGAAERLLFGPGYDASRALRNYSQSISNILQIERLARVAIETIAEALDMERGALLLITERDTGGADVRVIPGMGDNAPMNVAFAPDSPVLHALRDTNRPLTQYDIDMLPEFRDMDPEERQWQWALDVEVYVPVHVKRTLIGALVLGAKQTGEPYHAQDLDVLSTLAGQTAVALENARLFDDQRRLNMEISQLNEELTEANIRLQKLDKAKSDFLNITSHELRTPLTQVRGYADILSEMMQDEQINPPYIMKITTSIRKASDRLEAIYSAMIDISAIGVDALQLHFEPIRPVVFISQAVEKWQDALEQRQQRLEVHAVEELPPMEGDQVRLVQAFSNLVNNAIKFTPDGGSIEIWGRIVQGTQPVIEIVIADSGIGIDPQDHELIFEKFYRVGSVDLHSTGSVKFKGAGPGLGLAIARGVIEVHNGRIWVESEGHDEETCPGSRFHVLLPLRGAPSDPGRVAEQLKKTRPLMELGKHLVERLRQET
jgi:signal transduction histidine kinase